MRLTIMIDWLLVISILLAPCVYSLNLVTKPSIEYELQPLFEAIWSRSLVNQTRIDVSS
ncbi:hypothetical protein ACOME3_000939 [Neoechinorhynchus agilis]